MNESQRNTLCRYRRRLADDIILTEEFLAQFIEEGIFEWGMINIIKAEKTESEQIYKMLEMLPKRGPFAFDRFLSVLERDYPWLATLLMSSCKANHTREAATHETIRHPSSDIRIEQVHSGTSRGPPSVTDSCDVDVKKLVAAFVHRQFGQSKRISEKDKKAVEKFVSEQLQQERTRYQAMLPSTQVTSCSTPMSEMCEDVFHHLEIQEHLFKIHMKIEPHITNDHEEQNNNRRSIRERVLPDDLTFDIIHKEMEQLCKKLYEMEGQVMKSLGHFKPEMQGTPLFELVGRMHDVLRKQHKELEEMEDNNQRLLNEVNDYSEHIEKLEKERREYRTQVSVLHQDMAKVRQEKMALQERCLQLEKSHKERVEKESTLDNLRLLVKDLKSSGLTPRQAMGMDDGARGSQVRRSVRGSQVRPGVKYQLYARKFTTNTRTATKKYSGNMLSGPK